MNGHCFRWNRGRYYRAHHLLRTINRRYGAGEIELPEPAGLLAAYFELWARYPDRDDPLQQVMRERERYPDPDAPF